MHSVVNVLAGHFKMLSDLPANGQFNVSIDPHVDNDWTIFNRNGLIYLAEIVGPVNAKALGHYPHDEKSSVLALWARAG